MVKSAITHAMDISESFALDDAAKTAGRDTDEWPNVVLPLLFPNPPSLLVDLTRLMGNLRASESVEQRSKARDREPEKVIIVRFPDTRPGPGSKECETASVSSQRGVSWRETAGKKDRGHCARCAVGGGARWQAYARTVVAALCC